MRDAMIAYLALLDLDVELRDTIADGCDPPIRAALAAASMMREPMRALAQVADLCEAATLVAAGADEGRQWLDHLLADTHDHYTHAVWHLVAGRVPSDAIDDLSWLEDRLARRAGLAAMAVRRGLALPAFLAEPATGRLATGGAVTFADPFVPRGWTYAAWYGREDIDAPADLDDRRFGRPGSSGP